MPRDSNGTYSLPAGNPVVTETTISSTWANSTLDDIAVALTNSLDRNGTGAMTGPLKLVNGTAGAPGLTWGTETTSGLYRAGASDFRFSIASADVLTLTTALASLAPPLALPNGTAAAPAVIFTSDPNLGVYRVGVDQLGVSTDGTLRLTVGTTSLTSTLPWLGPDGAEATPAWTFSADTNTGVFRVGADDIGISCNGLIQLRLNTSFASFTQVVLAPAGSAAVPSLGFNLDQNTGLYSFAADTVGLTTGGTFRAAWSTTVHTLRLQTQSQDGSAAAPTYAYENDTNTGVYLQAADQLAFSEGGVGYRMGIRGVPQNIQNGNYTFVRADEGFHVYKVSGAGNTITIPSNASVPFPIGTVLTIVNISSNNVTIAITTDVLRLVGSGATGSRTLSGALGMATILKISATDWAITGTGVS